MRDKTPATIPDDVLLALPKFLKEWGTKSVCIGGGGEPFCHSRIADLILEFGRVGMPLGTITNGLALDTSGVRTAVLDVCRWIGFSVDSATAETHRLLKHPSIDDAFKRVCQNIEWLAGHRKEGRRPSITMKFCIHHLNYKEIYQFSKLAKELGADDVHFRPVYIPSYSFTDMVSEGARDLILKSRAELEDEHFHVYGIVHKFDKNWKRAIRFKKCRATPINSYFLADGTLALCCDRRDDRDLNLGSYFPFENVLQKWGSKEHKQKLAKINPQQCPRCTQCVVNEIIEKAIIQDDMCIEFV
jgi:MoaA/NifB/PqqE/SkfB family radical SAM enzyme